MTLEMAESILGAMERTSHIDLLEDALKGAIRYTSMRASFALMDPEGRRATDESRTTLHDAFIADCNILARAMNSSGEEVSWRDRLGTDRKEIGDLACWITAVLGLRAR